MTAEARASEVEEIDQHEKEQKGEITKVKGLGRYNLTHARSRCRSSENPHGRLHHFASTPLSPPPINEAMSARMRGRMKPPGDAR